MKISLPCDTDLEFEEPCGSCPYCDIDFDLAKAIDMRGYAYYSLQINCTHEKTCKYKEKVLTNMQ